MPLGWIFTVIKSESTTQLQNALTLPRPVSTWVPRRAMAAACARASATEAASAARDRAHMVVVEHANIDTDHHPHIDADHHRHTSANEDHALKSDKIYSCINNTEHTTKTQWWNNDLRIVRFYIDCFFLSDNKAPCQI